MPVTNKRFAIVASAAMLMSGCVSSTGTTAVSSAKGDDMGLCHAVNSCRGAGSCATANNHCAGQNTCKGKGWLPMTKSDCKTQGGHFVGLKKQSQ